MSFSTNKPTPEGLSQTALNLQLSRKNASAPAFRPQILRSVRMHPLLAGIVAAIVLIATIAYAMTQGSVYLAGSQVYEEPTATKLLSDSSAAIFDSNKYDTFLSEQMQLISRPDVLTAALNSLPSATYKEYGATVAQAVDTIQSQLKVARIGTSFQVSIGLKGSDPQKTADVVNAITTAYLDAVQKASSAESDQRAQLLGEERQRIEAELKSARAEQTSLGASIGVPNPSADGSNPYDAELSGIRGQLVEARAAHDVAAAQLASLSGVGSTRPDGLTAAADDLIAGDAGLGSMKATVSQRKAQLNEQMAGMTPANPIYKQDQDQIADLDRTLDKMTGELRDQAARRLQDKLRTDLQRTGDIESRLNGQLARQIASATSAAPRLQRAAEVAADIQRLDTRMAAVDDAMRSLRLDVSGPGQVRLSLPATPPEHPEASRKKLLLLAALPLAIFFGIAAAVIARKQNKRIYGAMDVDEVLGFPPLAVLPARADVSEMVFEEYVLRLAAGVESAYRTSGARTFLLTAVSLTSDISPLANALTSKFEEIGVNVIVATAYDMLAPTDAMPRASADTARLGPAELARVAGIWSEGFVAANVAKMKTEHGLVLIASEALLNCARTEYVARCADATILILDCGITTRQELFRAAELLHRLNVTGIGAVLEEVQLRYADADFRKAIESLEARQSEARRPGRPFQSQPAPEPVAAEPVEEQVYPEPVQFASHWESEPAPTVASIVEHPVPTPVAETIAEESESVPTVESVVEHPAPSPVPETISEEPRLIQAIESLHEHPESIPVAEAIPEKPEHPAPTPIAEIIADEHDLVPAVESLESHPEPTLVAETIAQEPEPAPTVESTIEHPASTLAAEAIPEEPELVPAVESLYEQHQPISVAETIPEVPEAAPMVESVVAHPAPTHQGAENISEEPAPPPIVETVVEQPELATLVTALHQPEPILISQSAPPVNLLEAEADRVAMDYEPSHYHEVLHHVRATPPAGDDSGWHLPVFHHVAPQSEPAAASLTLEPLETIGTIPFVMQAAPLPEMEAVSMAAPAELEVSAQTGTDSRSNLRSESPIPVASALEHEKITPKFAARRVESAPTRDAGMTRKTSWLHKLLKRGGSVVSIIPYGDDEETTETAPAAKPAPAPETAKLTTNPEDYDIPLASRLEQISRIRPAAPAPPPPPDVLRFRQPSQPEPQPYEALLAEFAPAKVTVPEIAEPTVATAASEPVLPVAEVPVPEPAAIAAEPVADVAEVTPRVPTGPAAWATVDHIAEEQPAPVAALPSETEAVVPEAAPSVEPVAAQHPVEHEEVAAQPVQARRPPRPLTFLELARLRELRLTPPVAAAPIESKIAATEYAHYEPLEVLGEVSDYIPTPVAAEATAVEHESATEPETAPEFLPIEEEEPWIAPAPLAEAHVTLEPEFRDPKLQEPKSYEEIFPPSAPVSPNPYDLDDTPPEYEEASRNLTSGRWDPIPPLRPSGSDWRDRPSPAPVSRGSIDRYRWGGPVKDAFSSNPPQRWIPEEHVTPMPESEPLPEPLLTRQWGLLSKFQQARLVSARPAAGTKSAGDSGHDTNEAASSHDNHQS